MTNKVDVTVGLYDVARTNGEAVAWWLQYADTVRRWRRNFNHAMESVRIAQDEAVRLAALPADELMVRKDGD